METCQKDPLASGEATGEILGCYDFKSTFDSFLSRTNRVYVKERSDGHCGIRSLERQRRCAIDLKSNIGANMDFENSRDVIREGRLNLSDAILRNERALRATRWIHGRRRE